MSKKQNYAGMEEERVSDEAVNVFLFQKNDSITLRKFVTHDIDLIKNTLLGVFL